MLFSFFIYVALVTVTVASKAFVLWHGLGSYSQDAFMTRVQNLIKSKIPDAYIVSMQIGKTYFEDFTATYYWNCNDQVAEGAKVIRNDPKLKDGYIGMGFSHGALMIRSLAQRFADPPAKTIIAMGGPQQGVYGMPDCPGLLPTVCNDIRKLLTVAAYTKLAQATLSCAGYWHDPTHEKLYREKSSFLADINNANHVNSTYVKNLLNLEALVLVKFLKDTVLVPTESSWLQYYVPGQAVKIQPLNESNLYTADRLGLKSMEEQGKLHFVESDSGHVQFTDEWFFKNIMEPYVLS